MKHIIIVYLLFISVSTFAQSQQQRAERDMQTMEKLYDLKNKETEEETLAQEKIFSYKNEVSEKIRENISKISNEQYESLDLLQSILWKQIIETRKFYQTSKNFLSNEIRLLNNYREKVLNRLYQYINNPDKSYQNQTNQVTEENKKIVDELTNCQLYNQQLIKFNNNLKSENEALKKQNDYLKTNNAVLINSSKELIDLTTKGAGNLEKSIEALKQKDLKIKQLEESLTKKDSIINR